MPNPDDLANKLTLKFTWENKKAFKVVADNDVENVTIIEMHENGNIALLWPEAQLICEKYVKAQLEIMGTEMKRP